MEGPYYDIDEILCEEQKIPSTFRYDCYNLGYLQDFSIDGQEAVPDSEGDENTNDLKRGTRLELPFWLAQPLAKRNLITVELPQEYGPSFARNLQANPEFNLHNTSPYYFEFGRKIAELLNENDLLSGLLLVFLERFKRILEVSQSTKARTYTQLLKGFTEIERKLFSVGNSSVISIRAWKKRKYQEIEKFTYSTNKRRRIMIGMS